MTPAGHQPLPERAAEPALVVVPGGDADRRRVEPDEQQPIAERRQVGRASRPARRRSRSSSGGVRVRAGGSAPSSSSGVIGRRSSSRGSRSRRAPGSARSGRRLKSAGRPGVGRRGRLRRARLDLGLGLGRLGLGLAEAASEGRAPLRQGLRPTPDHGRATRMTMRTIRTSDPMRPMVQRASARAARDRDDEADAPCASPRTTRPCCRPDRPPSAASMTSTSRSVARLALARDDPDRAVRPDAALPGPRAAPSASNESAPSRTTSVSGSGQPSVRSVVRSAI